MKKAGPTTNHLSDFTNKQKEADKKHQLQQDQGLANQVTGGGISRVDLLVESLSQKLSIKAPVVQTKHVPTANMPITNASAAAQIPPPPNYKPPALPPRPKSTGRTLETKAEVAAAAKAIFKKAHSQTPASSSKDSILETVDFLKGEWLQEIDADYQSYVAKSGGIRKTYWEEAYSALNALWDQEYYQDFMNAVEAQWKTGAYDNYIYITIPVTAKYPTYSYPQGVMFHIQYNCPASFYFEPASKRQPSLDFSDPNKGYLDEVKASIKSMHLDIYNIYSTAKKLGRTDIVDGMFYNIASYGCINEKIRHLNDFAQKCLKEGLGLPFDQTVQGILADYAKHVCDTHWSMPKMDYNTLAQYEGGKYFYLEDIVYFGKKNYPNLKSLDNKTINDLEETLEAWGICERRPTVAKQLSVSASTTYGAQSAVQQAPVVFFGSTLNKADFVYDDDFDSWFSGFQSMAPQPKAAPFVTSNLVLPTMKAPTAMTFSQGLQLVTQEQLYQAAIQAFCNVGASGPYKSLRALVLAKVKDQSDFDATLKSISSALLAVLKDPNPTTTSIKILPNHSSIICTDLLNVMLSDVGAKLNTTAELCNTSPSMTFSHGKQFVTQEQIYQAAIQAFCNVGASGPYKSLRALVLAKVKDQIDFNETLMSISSALLAVFKDPNPTTTSIKILPNYSSVSCTDLLNIMLSDVGAKLSTTTELCNTSANNVDVIKTKLTFS